MLDLPYEMQLSRDLDGYRLLTADGETEIILMTPGCAFLL